MQFIGWGICASLGECCYAGGSTARSNTTSGWRKQEEWEENKKAAMRIALTDKELYGVTRNVNAQELTIIPQ
jgi:hypothetical protein